MQKALRINLTVAELHAAISARIQALYPGEYIQAMNIAILNYITKLCKVIQYLYDVVANCGTLHEWITDFSLRDPK